MSFQDIERLVGVDSTALPFINEYLEEHPEANGMIAEVLEITEVKSGKGYLLKCPSFSVFCWKKDKAIAYVLEKIDDSREMSSPVTVACKVDSTSKNGYRLLLDEDEGPLWTRDGDLMFHRFEGKKYSKDDPNLPPATPPAIKPPSKRGRRS